MELGEGRVLEPAAPRPSEPDVEPAERPGVRPVGVRRESPAAARRRARAEHIDLRFKTVALDDVLATAGVRSKPAPWQTRRPPPAGGGACAGSSPWARTTYRSRGRSASRETVSGTILPATTTVERLCADALVDAERRTEARVAERVPPSRQAGGDPDAPRLARPWTEHGRFTERASS